MENYLDPDDSHPFAKKASDWLRAGDRELVEIASVYQASMTATAKRGVSEQDQELALEVLANAYVDKGGDIDELIDLIDETPKPSFHGESIGFNAKDVSSYSLSSPDDPQITSLTGVDKAKAVAELRSLPIMLNKSQIASLSAR